MSKLWPFLAVTVAALISAAAARIVLAHDWYGSTADPVYQPNCCGGHDCAPVDPAWVNEVREGYRLTMTVDQAHTVNPDAQAPVDAIVPWTRIQSPPVAEDPFYACIYDDDRTAPRYGVICFFATPVMQGRHHLYIFGSFRGRPCHCGTIATPAAIVFTGAPK